MTARDIARAQAAGRVVIGAVLVAAPEIVGVPWLGRAARRPESHVYSAALGVRDAALGAGVLAAAGAGAPARPWVLAGMASDAVDLAATWHNRRALPALGVAGTVALAGGSVALGAWLQSRLDQAPG